MSISPRRVSFLVFALALACGGVVAAEGFEITLKCEAEDKSIAKIIRMDHEWFYMWVEETSTLHRTRCNEIPEFRHGRYEGSRTTCTINPRFLEYTEVQVDSRGETLRLHFRVDRETGHFSLKTPQHWFLRIKQAIDISGTCAPTELPQPPKTLF